MTSGHAGDMLPPSGPEVKVIRLPALTYYTFLYLLMILFGSFLSLTVFRHEEERRRREEEMMRHREQEDLRRHPDGFKPNYLDNVSTAGVQTVQ